MRRLTGYGLLGLVAYLVFLLLQFPVAALAGYLGGQIPWLAVQSIHGSVFSGNVQGVVLHGNRVEALNWRWRPQALLMGRLEYEVTVTEPGLNVRARAGLGFDGRVRVAGLEGDVSLRKAISLATRAQLPLDGRVSLALDEFSLGGNGLPRSARGKVHLSGVRTTLGRPLQLGDYNTELTSGEQGIVGAVRDAGGPLEFTGTLTLDARGRYRLFGHIVLRDENNHQLREVLALLGRPGEDGGWKIDVGGMLKV